MHEPATTLALIMEAGQATGQQEGALGGARQCMKRSAGARQSGGSEELNAVSTGWNVMWRRGGGVKEAIGGT